MDPRLHYEPITEPHEAYIPHELPPAQNYEAYEFSFPREQRAWIRERDGGYSNMPIFDEHGMITGFDTTPTRVEIHHIIPQHFYVQKWGREGAKRYMHNPLNGIALDPLSHTIIHTEWMDAYKREYEAMPPSYLRKATLQDYVTWQVNQGRASWLDAYDPIFHMIATIRTVMYAEVTQTFPFQDKWLDQAVAWYTRMCASLSDNDQYARMVIEEQVRQDYGNY